MPRLTIEEIDRLLARNGIVRLAVVADDGSPLVVPLGYVYRDRRVLLTARERVGLVEPHPARSAGVPLDRLVPLSAGQGHRTG